MEHGEGEGRLCCIDPTERGDISSELAVDAEGNPLPHRRIQAVDPEKREKAIKNPNSGLVWEYAGRDQNGNGKIEFEEEFHRTLSSVAIKDGLLFAVDFSGLAHCFDAKTGKWHWSYDLFAQAYAQPLIVDDKVYVADEDGDIAIFNLSAKKHDPLTEINMGSSVNTAPIFVDGTLYIASRNTLFAIQSDDERAVVRDKKPDVARKPGFWPQWRGPNRDNVSTESGLLKEWPEDGPPLLWQAEGLGEGIASVAIAGGRVVTLGYRDEQEFVTAVSAETGEQLWMKSIGPAVKESPLMRWLGQRTPTLDGDRVYALRSDGDLVCLHVDDGRELWRKSYRNEFGKIRRYWGICDYPLVDGDKLICTPGGTKATIVALDKYRGGVIWKTKVGENELRNYAAMVATEGGGIRQYITYLKKRLVGVAAEDGRVLWQYEGGRHSTAHSVSPIARGDSILAYGGYGGGRVMLKLAAEGDGVELKEVYSHGGSLDAFQDSTLWIGDQVHALAARNVLIRFDALDGKKHTLYKRLGRGSMSMTYADGRLFLRDSTGTMRLIEPTKDDYVEKGQFTIPDHESAIGATNPVVAGGRLWLRDDNRLFCYDVRQGVLDEPRPVPRTITLQIGKAKPSGNEKRERSGPRSVFVPTPQDVVEKMLELAKVKKSDVVFDLGSGDGRIVIAAAKKYGSRAVGYEIDKDLVELSRENATKAKVEDLVTIHHQDLFKADLTRANVVAVYLLPKQLETLLPQLEKLKPGARIVSHHFEIPGVEVQQIVEVESKADQSKHKLYLWTAPLAKRSDNK